MPQQVKHQFQSTILGSYMYHVFSCIGGAADGDVCREDNLHIWLDIRRTITIFSREGRHKFGIGIPTCISVSR